MKSGFYLAVFSLAAKITGGSGYLSPNFNRKDMISIGSKTGHTPTLCKKAKKTLCIIQKDDSGQAAVFKRPQRVL